MPAARLSCKSHLVIIARHSLSLYDPCYKTTPGPLNTGLFGSQNLDVECLISNQYGAILFSPQFFILSKIQLCNVSGCVLQEKELYSSPSIYQSV